MAKTPVHNITVDIINNFKPEALQVHLPVMHNCQMTVASLHAPTDLAYAMRVVYDAPAPVKTFAQQVGEACNATYTVKR